MFIPDDLFAQEMKPFNWNVMMENAYNSTSQKMEEFSNHPDFNKYVAGLILLLGALMPVWMCWAEWTRLKRVEVELEDALADTEEQLDYERQVTAEEALFLEKEEKRLESFQKVKEQIGNDKQAWPVIVTNEVLALRKELNQIRKREIC
jgi:hypothetical protein